MLRGGTETLVTTGEYLLGGCAVSTSRLVSLPSVLGYANYVLVLENDYVNFGRRPHGLLELVCGDDSFLFPTVLPEWLNWPLLQGYDGLLQWRKAQSTPFAMWQWILCPGSLHLHVVFLR